MYKHFYSKFLKEHTESLHFASHSHHFWPDVTREAHIQYWDDAAKYVDNKWQVILDKVYQLEEMYSVVLNVPNTHQFAWASSTHDLLLRLFSIFMWNKPVNVLTTDSEFHSFSRQLKSWRGVGKVNVTTVAVEPFGSFNARMIEASKSQKFDIIFLSQVFFNSGLSLKLEEIVPFLDAKIICIDGYHAFMALPTDLESFAEKIVYLAGGYKYAQGGEGACFMWIPTSIPNPIQTGWFAGFKDLESDVSEITYSQSGSRFSGSTMDYSALYRQYSVMKLFKENNLTVNQIHQHVQLCQKHFLNELDKLRNPLVSKADLIFQDWDHQGHFLTFRLESTEKTKLIQEKLFTRGIMTDSRADRLRFGFGLYHNPDFTLERLENI